MSRRQINFYMDSELHDAVKVTCMVDDRPVSGVIRSLLAEHVAARRADPEFQARLNQIMAENQPALVALRDG